MKKLLQSYIDVRETIIFLDLYSELKKRVGPSKLCDFNESYKNISGTNGKYFQLYQDIEIQSGYCIDAPEVWPNGGCSWFDLLPESIETNLRDWMSGSWLVNEEDYFPGMLLL